MTGNKVDRADWADGRDGRRVCDACYCRKGGKAGKFNGDEHEAAGCGRRGGGCCGLT